MRSVNLLQADPDPADPARIAVEAARTADRLRTLSLVRLAAELPDGRTRAGATLALAQRLADRAATLDGRPARRLPALPATATGDVLAVCANDLVEALADAGDRADPEQTRAAVAALIQLRREL